MGYYSAGIILYNPDINRLRDNIESIQKQVDIVYCYNNNSENTYLIEKLIEKYSNVVLINDSVNSGIPMAINKIADIAIENNYTWLLTLDQDSICPADMIESFERYINISDIGIICPLIVDSRRPKYNKPKEPISIVDFCITSGSFMNLDVFKKLGGLDSTLFIGLVDDEYCYRLRLNNYKILQINDAVLDHELGELTPSKYSRLYITLGSLFHCEKIKALSYKRKVTPIRVYYATRNIIYLSHKYKNNPTYKFTMNYAVKNGISNILRSQNKLLVSRAFVKGIIDGIKYK